jgi:O-antigen ligase
MLWLQTLCTIPLALTSLMQYGGGAAGPDGAGRIAGYGDGLAGNPNDLALVLALTIPLTAALASSAASRVARLLATTILGMGIVAVMATFSRAGFVALVVVGMLWLAAQLRRRPLRAVGALVLAATLAWAMVPAGYGARLTTMTDIESDPTGSAQERWRDMGVATSYMLDHPVVGAGLGMDILALNELRGATWRRVHNAYLNYGVDLGLPGLGLFLLLLWTVIRGVRRVERRDEAGELGALAGGLRIALVTFAVAAFFYPVAYHFYFYSLAGMAVAAVRIERTRGVPAARAGSESRHG